MRLDLYLSWSSKKPVVSLFSMRTTTKNARKTEDQVHDSRTKDTMNVMVTDTFGRTAAKIWNGRTTTESGSCCNTKLN